MEVVQNGSKTLHLSTNPLESAAPDPLDARSSISGATGSSKWLLPHWLLQSRQALQSTLEIIQNRSLGPLKTLLGLTEPPEKLEEGF